jgi:CubicO group peptidase (beta-lactamase class C family)
MKKTAAALSIFILIIIIATPRLVGFQVWNIPAAIDMATGMGAKLACSSRYVTGLSEQQAKADIVSYSAAAALLELSYNDATKTVTATMQGMAQKQAKYREGLGCALELGDTTALENISIQGISPTEDAWPIGASVNTINKDVQTFTTKQLNQDNEAGLQTRALLVIKDGEIIAESYDDGFDSSSKLLGWSMGKSVTAMMLGRLDTIKGVDFQQTELFDDWKNDDRKNLNLVNLLQMSSGLDFDEPYVPGSDSTKMLFTAYSASDVALKSQLVYEPSRFFYYSSGTTNLLTRWLSNELGGTPQAMIDFTYNELFRPLHMANSIFETDSSGVLVGSSYLYSSARDWGRLAQLLLNDGLWEQKQLISTDWIKQAATPNTSDNDKRYGYQFWLNAGHEVLRWKDIPADAYAMQGNRSQRVMMIPSENTAIIRLGWTSGKYPTNDNFAEILTAIKAQAITLD